MKQNIIIRQANKADYNIIYHLIQTAFLTADHKDGTEQDFAVNLRNSENYIPQLDLVAELDGCLIGHIMFTNTCVVKADGGKYHTLMVAPLSVLLEFRNMGVGSLLMAEGFRRASVMGYQTAFLVGDPNYYQRFGYKPTHLYGINHETIPAEFVLVKEFVNEALKGVTGIIKL